MPSPPLANPVSIVAISIPAVTLAESTNISRVPAVTGIESPVVKPLETVPMLTSPLNGGARVTVAPGTGAKLSFGVGELYSCAVIVTVLPTRAAATATL